MKSSPLARAVAEEISTNIHDAMELPKNTRLARNIAALIDARLEPVREALEEIEKRIKREPLAKGDGHERDLFERGKLRRALALLHPAGADE